MEPVSIPPWRRVSTALEPVEMLIMFSRWDAISVAVVNPMGIIFFASPKIFKALASLTPLTSVSFFIVEYATDSTVWKPQSLSLLTSPLLIPHASSIAMGWDDDSPSSMSTSSMSSCIAAIVSFLLRLGCLNNYWKYIAPEQNRVSNILVILITVTADTNILILNRCFALHGAPMISK